MEDQIRFIDIAAWKEDRDELRQLRQTVADTAQQVAALAVLIQREADKIEHACDILDRMSRELERQSS